MQKLNLESTYLSEVKSILQQHIPDSEVWAYGSRVKGTCHVASDLDLVVRNPLHLEAPTDNLAQVKQAFQDSNLPIFVDLMDWAYLPETYQKEIQKHYVVIQSRI